MARVLVVEDHPDLRACFALTLETYGHEVVTAADGIEALAVIQESLPDVVLTDVEMPRCDGLQLVERLRASGSRVPVVAVTADPSGPRHRALRDLGVEVLDKPTHLAQLQARIIAITGERERHLVARSRAPLELLLAAGAGLIGVVMLIALSMVHVDDAFTMQVMNRCFAVAAAAIFGGAYMQMRHSSRSGRLVIWSAAVVWWALMPVMPLPTLLMPAAAMAAVAATVALCRSEPVRHQRVTAAPAAAPAAAAG